MDNATPATHQDPPPLSRRDFLGKVGLGAAAAATNVIVTPKLAAALGTTVGSRRQTVAVFGGGIAGLTAAHELIERGFDVTVYERRAWGGKARSTEVPGSAAGGRRPLPGEHGYRVPFGFYQNLPDTMRRIPFGTNPNGVFDNLVEAPQVMFARTQKRDLVVPLGSLDPRPYTPEQIESLIVGVLVQMELPPLAAAHFANRMVVFLSSCDARRLGQWDQTSWVNFIGADRYGDDYRKTLGASPEFTQASKGEDTSAKYMAHFFELLIYNLLGFGANGPAVRVLNLPTNEAWIDPWLARLGQLGVGLEKGYAIKGFTLRDGRVVGATVRGPSGLQTVVADWYVCALPVERARQLWSPAILAADPSLARMQRLGTAWYNGIQYYLRERSQIVKGHVLCADSPWSASFITQAQFWAGDFAGRYGDGRAHDKLSAILADWTKPGVVYGKAAYDCTPDEIVRDLWEQIKRHVNEPGQPPKLSDEMLLSWDIDQSLLRDRGRWVNEDPLVLPTTGTEQYRPDVSTAIPNLMLCGDYLSGSWIITTMESACHAGRRAANAILERAGSHETPARTIEPYRPPEWEPFKAIDQTNYRLGLPNVFDTPLTTPLLGAL